MWRGRICEVPHVGVGTRIKYNYFLLLHLFLLHKSPADRLQIGKGYLFPGVCTPCKHTHKVRPSRGNPFFLTPAILVTITGKQREKLQFRRPIILRSCYIFSVIQSKSFRQLFSRKRRTPNDKNAKCIFLIYDFCCGG